MYKTTLKNIINNKIKKKMKNPQNLKSKMNGRVFQCWKIFVFKIREGHSNTDKSVFRLEQQITKTKKKCKKINLELVKFLSEISIKKI